MKIESALSAQEYLSELKKHRFHRPDDLSKLSVHSVGPFFGITRRVYVSGENIRKHTFINSAFGYVRNSSDGCSVRFFRTTGHLHPLGLLLISPISAVIYLLLCLFSTEIYFSLELLLTCTVVLSFIIFGTIVADAISHLGLSENEWNVSKLMIILTYPEKHFNDKHKRK